MPKKRKKCWYQPAGISQLTNEAKKMWLERKNEELYAGNTENLSLRGTSGNKIGSLKSRKKRTRT